jgi:protein-disulfide isomerase
MSKNGKELLKRYARGLAVFLLVASPLVFPAENRAGTQAHSTLNPATAKKLHVFLRRFAAFAPGLHVTFKEDALRCPPGFSVVHFRAKSSNPLLGQASDLLLSDDGTTVFFGHALLLPRDVMGASPRITAKRLTDYFSQKAGRTMRILLDSRPGPAGTFPSRILVDSPLGNVESTGALSGDGKWFLFGVFYPLTQDPRQVRMERLALKGRIAMGAPDARITVVEIADFQCPECAELQPVLEALAAKYSPRLKVVRVDFPQWRVHDWAARAAEWCRCAGRIDPEAYWPLARVIFANQGGITSANFEDTVLPQVRAWGIPLKLFHWCLRGGSAKKEVLEDMRRVAFLGLEGTPTVLVNGRLLQDDITGLLEPAVNEALDELHLPSRRSGRPDGHDPQHQQLPRQHHHRP